MFKVLTLLLALITITGCTTLQPDPVEIDAQNAGYPSAEVIVNNVLYNGIAVAKIRAGQPLNNLGLKVQGYFSGRARITSTDCAVDIGVNYDKSQLIPVRIPGLASRDCFFQISITPNYPYQENSSVTVSPLTGWVYIRVMSENESFTSITRKLSGSWRSSWQLPVAFTQPVKIIGKGCGLNGEQVIIPGQNQRVIVKLEDFVLRRRKEVCVFRATVFSPEYSTPLELAALITQYDSLFNPLSVPAISYSSDKIKVQAEEGVAILSLGETAVYTNKASFKFNDEKPNILRLYTVKGRILIGEWSATNREWTWKR